MSPPLLWYSFEAHFKDKWDNSRPFTSLSLRNIKNSRSLGELRRFWLIFFFMRLKARCKMSQRYKFLIVRGLFLSLMHVVLKTTSEQTDFIFNCNFDKNKLSCHARWTFKFKGGVGGGGVRCFLTNKTYCNKSKYVKIFFKLSIIIFKIYLKIHVFGRIIQRNITLLCNLVPQTPFKLSVNQVYIFKP